MNLNFSQEQVSAFRMQRHNLLEKNNKNIIKICSNVCGVQAQVLSAAYLSLNCRNQNMQRETIDKALIKDRSLVRTSLMRQTLHIIPSNEYSLYINALKRSRLEAYKKRLLGFGVNYKEIEKLNQKVVDLLSDKPRNKNELFNIIKPRLNKNMSRWSEQVWSIFKPAIIEGLICYYPSNGNKSTFVRTEKWLPAQKEMLEKEAKRILLGKYLKAYGPATVKDFAFWTGMLMKEASEIWETLKKDIQEVKVQDSIKYILKKDLSDLRNSAFDKTTINILPNFDVYLLAHADKNHFIKEKFYKKIFRNNGWISPVVLLNGEIVGTWSILKEKKQSIIKIELFNKIDRLLKVQIKSEVNRLENFTDNRLDIKFVK